MLESGQQSSMAKLQKLDPRRKVPDILFPEFQVGCPVEVSSKEEGFTGARFEATIVEPPSPIPNCGEPNCGEEAPVTLTATVEYKALLVEEGSRELLRERVEISSLRPPPLPLVKESYELCDIVDAFYKDAWWTGFVSVILEGGRGYVVLFSNPSDQLILQGHQLRPHVEWVDENWIRPRKKCMVDMLFSPGAAVEVNPIKNQNEENINDAWFPAKVLENVGNKSYVVKFERGEHFKETVDIHHIRPSPPVYMKDSLFLFEKVESFSGLGWCSGVVIRFLPGKRYIVDFKNASMEKECGHHELRPYLEWKNGKWVQFKESGEEVLFVSESVPKIPSKRSRKPRKPSTKYNQNLLAGKKCNFLVNNSPNVRCQARLSKTIARRSSVILKHNPRRSAELITKNVKCAETISPELLPKIVKRKQRKSAEAFLPKIVKDMQTKSSEVSGTDSIKGSYSETSAVSCTIEIEKRICRTNSNVSDDDDQPLAMLLKKICPAVVDSKLASQGTIETSSDLLAMAPQGINKPIVARGRDELVRSQSTTINGVLSSDFLPPLLPQGNKAAVPSEGTTNEVIEVSSDFLALVPQCIINEVTETSAPVALPPQDNINRSVVARRDESLQAGVGNSCIGRTSSFWKQLEEMDVFQRMPQNPHFSPLKEFGEVSRESRAIGYMVGFECLVKKTLGLRIGDPRSVFDDLLEYINELKIHGFNVELVQSCLDQKLSLKTKRQELDTQTQEFESKLIEPEKKKAKYQEEEEKVQSKIKQLEETFSHIRKRKLVAESEIAGLKNRMNVIKGLIEHTERDFQCLLDAKL